MGKSGDHPLHNPSLTPLDVVVRNLRRRMWDAFAREDAAAVLWLYKATRLDWEDCLRRERESPDTDESTTSSSLRGGSSRKRLGTLRKNSKSRVCAVPAVGLDPTLQASRSEEGTTKATSLLLQHFLPSEPFIEDDFRDPSDPYPAVHPDGKRVVRSESSAPRARFALSALLGRHAEERTTETKRDDDNVPLTTPLHEAARMGNADLVRFMLAHVAVSDPNARNGKGQTALHCVAGGITRREEQRSLAVSPLAIRVPHVQLPPLGEEAVALQHAKRAARVVGRLFGGQWAKESKPKPEMPVVSLEEGRKLALDRIDATLALLSWCHPDGEGVEISTNAVDDYGRTALHYAAEAGRNEICHAFLSREETFLTLVDQQRNTPCDLAGRAGHERLAAHLEARAILYRDPYGMDDELLAQILQNSAGEFDEDDTGTKLVAPFAWFKTYHMDEVQSERERRVQEALLLIHKVLDRRLEGERALEGLLGEPVTKEEPDSDIHIYSQVHSGHVEMLLKNFTWDVKKAVVAFAQSPSRAFSDCKIGAPPKETLSLDDGDEDEVTCLICCDTFSRESGEWNTLEACSHGFCISCLGDYIANAAASNSDGLALKCPHHDCWSPLSQKEIFDLSRNRNDYDRLVSSSNTNFVMGNESLRFCPHPDCLSVVKFGLPNFAKEAGLDSVEIFHQVGAVCTRPGRSDHDAQVLSYQGVNDPNYYHFKTKPKSAHRFCFSCGEPFAHWPLNCERLDDWKQEVATHLSDIAGENLNDDDFNGIAQKLWMKANTRPCPKCQIPIEKDQGCNHMTCSNPSCHYEFCWICRNDWKLHSSQTGGFFRCNRWQENMEEHEYYDKPPAPDEIQEPTDEDLSDPSRMRVVYGTAMHESRVTSKKSKEVGRFIHHFHRWSAHSQSRKLENEMRETVCQRLEPVVDAAKEIAGDSAFNFGGRGLSFLFAAFSELDECRSILLHSYPYAFYRYATLDLRNHRYKQYRHIQKEKKQFEKLQSELELLTENMSDIVARKHLRANESQIQYMTFSAAQKRKDLTYFLLTTLTDEKKEIDLSAAAVGEPGLGPSFTRIVGLTDGEAADDDDIAGDESALYMEEVFQRSLRDFQVQMDVPDLSDIDSDGFGEHVTNNYPAWSCPDCTFRNENRHVPFCEICGQSRPHSA